MLENDQESTLLCNRPIVKEAYDFYHDWPENPFFRYVGIHRFNNGYIFCDPEYFIMGRPVDSHAPKHQIVDPEFTFERCESDCWFIWLYAGDLTKAFTIVPYWLPYVAYERRDRLQIRETSKIMKLLMKDQSNGKWRKS